MNERAPHGSNITCPAYCCVVLPIVGTLEEIADDTEDPDSPLIASMLEPLTHRQAVARAKKFDVPTPIRKHEKGPDTLWYRCRNWDEETRLCRIYESRPEMCRDYPYHRGCHNGCGYEPPKEIVMKWLELERAGKLLG